MNLSNKAVINANRFFVPASSYSVEQLADLYNQTRVDYIVPMSMNSKRMADYMRFYDIDLELSTIALDSARLPIGLVMIGIRADCAWITRLGVLPDQRGNGLGQYLMEISINQLREQGIREVQLEVIRGN